MGAYVSLCVQLRDDAGCQEYLQIASYDSNELNFFFELPVLNISDISLVEVTALSDAIKALLEPMLAAESEIKPVLLSRFVRHDILLNNCEYIIIFI